MLRNVSTAEKVLVSFWKFKKENDAEEDTRRGGSIGRPTVRRDELVRALNKINKGCYRLRYMYETS